MTVLVDTSVWSLALRRKSAQEHPAVIELRALIEEMQVQMIGPIRQELLSGISEQAQYERLRDHLRAFPDLELTTGDFERAAEFFNICRGKGVQGSNTDFLICAISAERQMSILTTDKDFEHFQEHLPIKVHIGYSR